LFRFGVFELDGRSQELRRAGVLVKLSPQQFRVLRMLVEHGGEVCTREEIRSEIWGSEVHVDFERSLNVCVAGIRSALNDDSEASRFIQTVPRQGYRFVAQVDRGGAAAPMPVAVRRPQWWIGAVTAIVVAAGVAAWAVLMPGRTMRLAVLPFENLGDASDAPVALGLTDELTTQLGAASPGKLAVVGRTSAARYASRKPGLDELAVDYVVEGSVRTEAGQSRIAVRLVEARGQTQVWNGTFPGVGSGKLELQETVASSVARAVVGKLFSRAAPVVVSPYSADPEAAEAYWNGRYLDRKDPEKAIEWFTRAAARDAKFAAPRAAMAETWLGRALSGSPTNAGEAFANAMAAGEEALRIDDRNAEAHAAMGTVLFWNEWNARESRRHFERALELNASLARAHHDYAFLLVETGAAEAGINELRTGIALDPLAPRVNLDAGWVFLQARRLDEAVRYAKRALELEPRLEEARLCIARAALYRGTSGPEAMEELRRSPNPYYRAMGAAMTGRYGEALDALDQAMRARSSMMVMIGTEPAFDKLRGEARFRAMVRKVGMLR
jgi:DNA-binding winged helix-turn-helix (wHTH) protein/TolB-like protein/tetratricopeptide (TPR) repeat protein